MVRLKVSLLNKSFWSGRRVFVTGHTGFKGSWLVVWLNMLGADVKGYALKPETSPNMFEALELENSCTHIEADISDIARLKAEINSFNPEIVLHLAAQPLVRRSYSDPLNTFQTNVMGTANVLEACRDIAGLKSIVIVTTDKCYENKSDGIPFVESDRLGGYDPYSNSKACAELVASSFRDSFFNPVDYAAHGVVVATARAGNVIGGGDWSDDRLIPDAVRAFYSDQVLGVRMPHAIRPWQHVIEPILGYLLLAQSSFMDGPDFSQAWNFGPSTDQVLNVGDIVELAAKHWSGNARWEDLSENPSLKESNVLLLESSKAREKLAWVSHLNIESSLALTLDWYAAFYRQASPQTLRKLSKSQIDHYTTMGY